MVVSVPTSCLLLLAAVAASTPMVQAEGVTYRDSSHRLYYVPSVANIDYSAVGVPAADFQDVPAFELENEKGVKIKAIAQGATLVELSLPDNGNNETRTNYLWDHVEGATYYGTNTNNFPLRRGMIVNGGVRFTAVAPEHGLYYDIDWDVAIDDSDPDAKSIILSIVDNDETRSRASTYVPEKPAGASKVAGFSSGQFSRDGADMSAYPTTDMTFTLKITLRNDEDFVRLRMSVTNTDTANPKQAEAWLPMTFPINEESIILSRQRKRWRRDNWCLNDVTPNVVEWKDYDFLQRPLDWPMGCIFYDIGSMEGKFHGVTTDSAQGKGVVYYSPEKDEHYTKVWSWGKQGNAGNDLDGRPASDYYEAWSGGTNFAFFQTRAFLPETELSWEVAILPIISGLSSEKTMDNLLDYVDSHIDERMAQLGDVQGVETRTLGGELISGGEEEPSVEASAATGSTEQDATAESSQEDQASSVKTSTSASAAIAASGSESYLNLPSFAEIATLLMLPALILI